MYRFANYQDARSWYQGEMEAQRLGNLPVFCYFYSVTYAGYVPVSFNAPLSLADWLRATGQH